MQTRFSAAQLEDADVAEAEAVLRRCVHCGFCTATCPTYVLLGDELDSPRGRIYLIKDMLESGRPATGEVVHHLDRCLSCLGCVTTCPSGVDYRRLIDHARVHVERTYRRPWGERLMRAALAHVLPYPGRFRLALGLAAAARRTAGLVPARLRAALELVPPGMRRSESSAPAAPPAPSRPAAARRARVALLGGCVQSVLAPGINAAAARVLARAGAEVVAVPGCCGAIVHHMGRDAQSRALAATLVDRLHAQIERRGLDAIVVTASGCGTHVKDLGHLFRDDAQRAGRAAAVAERARDVTEVLAELGLPPPAAPPGLRVAYHSACSLQHGQRIERPPRELLRQAGYAVREIAEGHLCCGSAGTYNLLQPQLAARLRERKCGHIARTDAEVVAAGNIGCIAQLAAAADRPVVHTVELLDWAHGGPRPAALGGPSPSPSQ